MPYQDDIEADTTQGRLADVLETTDEVWFGHYKVSRHDVLLIIIALRRDASNAEPS